MKSKTYKMKRMEKKEGGSTINELERKIDKRERVKRKEREKKE